MSAFNLDGCDANDLFEKIFNEASVATLELHPNRITNSIRFDCRIDGKKASRVEALAVIIYALTPLAQAAFDSNEEEVYQRIKQCIQLLTETMSEGL